MKQKKQEKSINKQYEKANMIQINRPKILESQCIRGDQRKQNLISERQHYQIIAGENLQQMQRPTKHKQPINLKKLVKKIGIVDQQPIKETNQSPNIFPYQKPNKIKTLNSDNQTFIKQVLKKQKLKNIEISDEILSQQSHHQQKSRGKNKEQINSFQSSVKLSSSKQRIFPFLAKNHSKSTFINTKVKTQPSNQFRLKNKSKNLSKQKTSKQQKSVKNKPHRSLSQKRLRQDYKYLFQNDDSERYNQRVKPLFNEEKKKIKLLKIKEQMLGKIVLERVQNHLRSQHKQSQNFIQKIKSQKQVDQALIEFIKTKIKRADRTLDL